MVVRIHEPAMNLKGDFVLKVYDRCYSPEIRHDSVRDEWAQRET